MPVDYRTFAGRGKESRNPKEPEKTIHDFSAISPKYTFDDIVLPDDVLSEIKSIIALNMYKKLIYDEWGLSSVMKGHKNISVNLYGCSGTGKSMTAHAIAAELDKKVLLVNYSEIESKFVGETAKNLASLFQSAMENDAAIIFDEADALLSKRVTAMHSATDVSVNQTRNVLLKILDDFEGIVIFTTNFIQNFDHAFMRRIMSHIKYEMPNEAVREKLWEYYLVDGLPLSEKKDIFVCKLKGIGEVTGSDISTAVLKAAVKAAAGKKRQITIGSIEDEIKKITAARESLKRDDFTITTRKVSEDYVKEKISTGGIINGDN